MPYSLRLSAGWRSQRWKVKIRDKERLEPPHVTLLRGTRSWRLSLRTGAFLDAVPDPAEVPPALVTEVRGQLEELVKQWDAMYPENPVSSMEGHDD